MSRTIAKVMQSTGVNHSSQFVVNDIAYNEVLSFITALKDDATNRKLTEAMRKHTQVTLQELDDELGVAIHYVGRRLEEAKADSEA